VECSGEAKQTVIVCGMLLLVGRGNGAAIRLMQAQLGEREIAKSGSLGKLRSDDCQQQWLHHQRVDRDGADQASPEAPL